MARSVSNARVVQEEAEGFCRLYWLGLRCEGMFDDVARGVYALSFSFVFLVVCLAFCSMCRSRLPFPVAGYCQLCLGWMARCLAIGLRILCVLHIAVH